MNQDIKDIYEKQTTSWSDSDRYIYSSDFVYLHIYSEKIHETNEWQTSYIYDKYIEIDKGVYASSIFNRKFETKNDLNYFKHPIYAFTEDLAIFSKEIVNEELELKEFIDENLIEKTKTNLDGDIVLSNVYSFSYNYNLFTELKENEYVYLTVSKDEDFAIANLNKE